MNDAQIIFRDVRLFNYGRKIMEYVLLGISIVLELIATTLLKFSNGFTKLLPTIACIIAYCVCFFCFSKALNKINLGIAYALWSGIGIVVTTIISSVVFKQGTSLLGILGITLIISGCIILNLFGSAH